MVQKKILNKFEALRYMVNLKIYSNVIPLFKVSKISFPLKCWFVIAETANEAYEILCHKMGQSQIGNSGLHFFCFNPLQERNNKGKKKI